MSFNRSNVLYSLKANNNNELFYIPRQYYPKENNSTAVYENAPTMSDIYSSSIDFSSSTLPQRGIKAGFLSGQQSSTAMRKEETNNHSNNWRKSSHDTNNNTPDNNNDLNIVLSLASSSTGKRSSSVDSELKRIKKKRKTEDEEVVLFGPIPTMNTITVKTNDDDLIMNDETIFQELERIMNNNNTILSPPTSPILSYLTTHDELLLNDDFVLFP